MSALCSRVEHEHRDRARRRRLIRSGAATPGVLAHDVEHKWRAKGEQQIRDEMEQRVIQWLHTKNLSRIRKGD